MTNVGELFETAYRALQELQKALEAGPELNRTDAARISNLEYLSGQIHRKALRLFRTNENEKTK